ncbi:EF-hand calcium-binding domain-containing protein 11-like [Prorops nasuta]|uniref:EF-hand calcium-binding domain-containing protein 11-like n=1 Tax=Prorops nasuta TaxID=863751 RepID=UPI0034CDEE16
MDNKSICRAKMFADKNNKGWLTNFEYKIAMTVVFGCCSEELQVTNVLQNNYIEKIYYEDFVQMVFKHYSSGTKTFGLSNLFTLMDKDSKGFIKFDDLIDSSSFVKLKISKSVWKTIFKEIDYCKKNFINIYDLSILFNKN